MPFLRSLPTLRRPPAPAVAGSAAPGRDVPLRETRRRSFWRRFKAAEAGVAAVEFALILPLMVFLFLGTSEIGEALRVARRVEHVAFSVADLLSQSSSVSAAEVNAIFSGAQALMSPYSSGNLKIVVSVVDDKKKVVWSRALNGTALSAGSNAPITIGNNVIPSGTQVIVVETAYTYKWLVATNWAGFGNNHGYTFDRYFIERPRLGDTVSYSG
jgi:Flp pilus assembly protein TadG